MRPKKKQRGKKAIQKDHAVNERRKNASDLGS